MVSAMAMTIRFGGTFLTDSGWIAICAAIAESLTA